MAKIQFNGLTRWIIVGITVITMTVTFFVRAALVEERLDTMDTRHTTAIEGVKDVHDKDIGYVREDIAELKTQQTADTLRILDAIKEKQ